MSVPAGAPIPTRIACNMCKCKNYPDCSIGEEFCENCIDGGCGSHLKMTSGGDGIRDVLEDHELCKRCDRYCFPEDIKNEICEKCYENIAANACDKCGDITNNCMCYQHTCKQCKSTMSLCCLQCQFYECSTCTDTIGKCICK